MSRPLLQRLLIPLFLCGLLVCQAGFARPAGQVALTQALLDLALRWPRLKLVFRPEQLEGFWVAAGVEAETPEQALQQVLASLPFKAQPLGPDTYLVAPAEPAPAVKAPTRQVAATQPRQQPAHPLLMEELVTVGTRSRHRRLLHSTVPVDLVAGAALERSAPASLGEQLQSQVPSFNYSRTMVSDGADLVRPATLRGMNPDQLLVMIDGKRRHHQAQINIQQVVGRGSSGVDMNAIPTAAIERVEVLRSGASAQYGSDAIAGVLNLRLKRGPQPLVFNAQYGVSAEGDGQSLIGSLAGGMALADEASLFMSFEGQDRAATNRAGVDYRFDPARVSMRIGDPDQRSWSLFGHARWALDEAIEFYAFGGSSRRAGQSAGFYRGAGAEPGQPPVSARYIPALDPWGFLPLQRTRTEDDALTAGMEWLLDDNWLLDVSLGVGENRFLQGSDYSVNVSLGSASPRSADNGELAYQLRQASALISGEVALNGVTAALVTAGLEQRQETYHIRLGDLASYTYGPTDDFSLFIPSPLDPCPEETGPSCSDGQPRSRAQAGMQAFPGYRLPVAARRTSLAAFAEAELDLRENLALTLASRWEHTADTARNLTGKLALNWQFAPGWYWRSALASGFRAPGLNQQAFTHVITNIGADLLTNTLHAAQGNPALAALGFEGLKPERSRHLSSGWVFTPDEHWYMSVDLFYLRLSHAIAMSNVIAAEPESCAQACVLRDALAPQAHNLGAIQFLYNAYNSEVRGADGVLRYQWQRPWGVSQLALLAHANRTRITGLLAPPGLAPERLFSPAQVMLVESGQPRRRLSLSYDWQYAGWALSARLNRYGSVQTSYFTESGLGLPVPEGQPQYHKSGRAWLVDFDLSHRFSRGLTLALGANNLFDTRPKKLPAGSYLSKVTGGSFVYPWESTPYGINGAFYYVRTELRW